MRESLPKITGQGNVEAINKLIPLVMDTAHGKGAEWGEGTKTRVPAPWGHRAIGRTGTNF